MKAGDRLPSVRELAIQLAVNQNTVLKVYNELCREAILQVVRGDGTYVSSGKQTLNLTKRKQIVADLLRPAVTQAAQLELSEEQLIELIKAEYQTMKRERKNK